MGLRLTTKVQVSGWRFLLRRLEHAIVRRDTRMFDDPLQFYSRSIALGIVVAVLILAGAALLAYFKPQGKLGGTSLFTDRATNQLYVLLSGQLHPVYNLTSARLVLGNPANPATVKSSELSKLPMGQTVGIPGAPYATPVSAGSTSIWTLCDTVARADSTSPVVQTAVIAMPLEIDASIDPLQSHEAVLVSYQGETWIVTTKGRHAIDLTDRALTSSMGIPVTARPTPISEGMFNALPDMGPWQLPPIPAAGAPNSLGLPDDLVIGSVFQIHTDKGPQYYVVLPDGIAQVNATTAAALRATQAHGLVAPPAMVPSLVVRIAERVYPSPLPDEPLKIVSRPQDPALCWSWQRSAGDQSPQSTVLSGRHLPISPSAMNMGIKQIHGTATVYLDGGKFVALQSPDPRYTESMYYIDPQGVRYGVPNAETAKSLGLSSPQNAPWEIVRLLELVSRMGEVLTGELDRRQSILRQAGMKVGAAGALSGVAEYEKYRERGADLPPLPTLFVVVDEFAELLQSHPDFIGLFDRICRVGRSLRVHLLLATQSLQTGGVRIDKLEPNLTYRIALRTTSSHESKAVIGTPEAQYITNKESGVGFLRVGMEDPVKFSTFYISGPYMPPAAGVETNGEAGGPGQQTTRQAARIHRFTAAPVLEEAPTP